MATYLVVRDDYAGWNPTGRNFALISVGIGAVSLLSWMSLHGHLGALRPGSASDQLFLSGFVWLGVGCFCLMAFAALGSVVLSLRSRGTVSITAEGVFRTVGAHTRSLAWSEMQGLVPRPYGGVTLVAAGGKSDIVIPQFLDDSRACMAEIRDRSIQILPVSILRRRRKRTWFDTARIFFFIFLYALATTSHESHRVRISSFSAAVALTVWLVQIDWAKADQTTPRWIAVVIFLGIILFGFWCMALSW